jgi:hypothetical protein
VGIAFTCDSGRKETPAGDAKEIGDPTAEFKGSILAELVAPVLAVAACLH